MRSRRTGTSAARSSGRRSSGGERSGGTTAARRAAQLLVVFSSRGEGRDVCIYKNNYMYNNCLFSLFFNGGEGGEGCTFIYIYIYVYIYIYIYVDKYI